MSVVVKITPRLVATRTEELISGIEGGNIDVSLPYSPTISEGAITLTCTKLWVAVLALQVSTPVTLDLSALTGGKGDTAFTAVKMIDVRNNEAVGSGKVLLIGGAATNAFAAFFGAATDIRKVDPGCPWTPFTQEAAGHTVSTNVSLKLDPGGNAISVTVVIAGD